MIEESVVHPLNDENPIFFMLLGIVMSFSPVHPYSMFYEVAVKDVGIVKLDKPVELENRSFPHVAPMLLGSLNSFTPVQYAKMELCVKLVRPVFLKSCIPDNPVQ